MRSGSPFAARRSGATLPRATPVGAMLPRATPSGARLSRATLLGLRLVALTLVSLTLLVGCGQQAPSGTGTGAGTPDAPPTATAAPQPSATPDFDPAGYTCESILPPSFLDVFKAREPDGFALQADFVERSRTYGGDLVAFVDLGGILCEWGYPAGGVRTSYGHSTITEAEADERLAALLSGGFVTQPDDRGTLVVNARAESFPQTYLFVDGHWFYASTPALLDVIVDNLIAR